MTDQEPQRRTMQAAADGNGRLAARPKPPAVNRSTGPHPLGLDATRDGWLYVPDRYRSAQPAPLLVFLHGAGGGAHRGKRLFQFIANRTGILLLVPESRGCTWDIIRGDFGPDVRFLDQALAHTFTAYALDAARLALGGFSDGASYALSLGLSNGDLFTHIIAWSPGFAAPARPYGRPRVFMTLVPAIGCYRSSGVVGALCQACVLPAMMSSTVNPAVGTSSCHGAHGTRSAGSWRHPRNAHPAIRYDEGAIAQAEHNYILRVDPRCMRSYFCYDSWVPTFEEEHV